MKVPIASNGTYLITTTDVELPKIVTLTTKLDNGLPKEVEIEIFKSRVIDEKDSNSGKALMKYFNRKIDLLMTEKNFTQDGRGFYEDRAKDLGKYYTVRRGIWLATHISEKGELILIADPLTQIRAKLNLLDALKVELERLGLSHWKEAKSVGDQINKALRSKAYNLRSTYVEPRHDNYEHNIYKFIGFNFNKGLTEDSDPKNPVNFHRSFNRSFDMDQPEVEVIARGGFRIRHIPQLLEEHPSTHMLKRFGVSEKLHAVSLLSAPNRYYETLQLLKPLIDAEFIEKMPTQVEVIDFKPVIITVKDDYINLQSNLDFQKYFTKGKILKDPCISTLSIFATAKDAQKVDKLKKALCKVFKNLNFPIPKINEHIEAPEALEDFTSYVLNSTESFGKEDLALVIFDLDEDIEDFVYNSIKRASLKRLFPVQFVDSSTINVENKELITNIANPLFVQIVAKCGGQPYGLQPGFMPEGTLVVGIDHYKDPFKENSQFVSTVVLFDNTGSYFCGSSNLVNVNSSLHTLLKQCFEKLIMKTQRRAWRQVLFFEDTGIGTMNEKLEQDARDCEKIAKEIGAKYALITANKTSHMRLYTGNPADDLSADKTSPFTVAIKMRNPNQFLAVSTEPITSRVKMMEFGTPRPVLYEIFSKSEELDLQELKEETAKIVIWLCRHSWVSPSSTRLPAPLYFANKLSKLVSATKIPLDPDATEAPLYL
ncbi:MAG: Piwi domain-containing protein [Candidatus Jordarchaeaceae archaeon]